MSHYKVTWTIDICANNPREAAEKCLAIHRDPFSTATFFEVTDVDSGEHVDVDLEEAI